MCGIVEFYDIHGVSMTSHILTREKEKIFCLLAQLTIKHFEFYKFENESRVRYNLVVSISWYLIYA